MKTVDARGLSCPVPVIRTKHMLETQGSGEVTVLLDEEVARENVTRLARSLGWQVEVEEKDDEFTLTMQKVPL